MFYESMKYADNTFVRFKNYMFWKQKKKVREFDGLFIVKQRKNPSKDREKHSITYRVSPYSFFVL